MLWHFLTAFLLFTASCHWVESVPTSDSLIPSTSARALLEAFDLTDTNNYALPARIITPASSLPSEVTDESGGVSLAISVETTTKPPNPENVRLSVNTIRPIQEDDVILVTFYGRRPLGTMMDASHVTLVIQQTSAPHDILTSKYVNLGKGWTKFQYAFKSTRSYSSGQVKVTFYLGHKARIVELGGIRIDNYHKTATVGQLPDSTDYPGRELTASWRATANERIDRHRKSNLDIIVKDGNGNPVPSAIVKVEMQRHQFDFGTVVKGGELLGDNAQSDKYRSEFLSLFNTATIGNELGWHFWDRYPTIGRKMIDWLQNHSIPIRGHPLVWPGRRFMPPPVWQNYDQIRINQSLTAAKNYLRSAIINHIQDEVSQLKGKMDEWIVVNERYHHHDVTDILGSAEMSRWFQEARQNDPKPKLCLNDIPSLWGKVNDKYHSAIRDGYVKSLLDANAPIDCFGIESHMGWKVGDPAGIYSILESYANLSNKLELKITEFDQGITDERLQADTLRDVMMMTFSHPRVTSFHMWGFWDKNHWVAHGGLYRDDWSKKPNWYAYRDLVFGKWWTNVNTTTSSTGRSLVRGFKGDYRITVTKNSLSTTIRTSLTDDRSLIITLGGASPSPSPRIFQINNLGVFQSSGDIQQVVNQPECSSGTCLRLNANSIGDFVTFELPNITPGTYSVVVRVKEGPNCGIFQLSTSGQTQVYSEQGSPKDLYDATQKFSVLSLGTREFTHAGTKFFRFRVDGKNSASAGLSLVLDTITLTPQ